MQMTTREVGGVPVFACSGELITEIVEGLAERFIDTLRDGVDCVVLNLGAVSRIDIAGLGGVYSCLSAARRVHVPVAVILPRAGVDTLTSVRLLTLGIPVFSFEQEAIEEFHRSETATHSLVRRGDLRAA